MTHHRTGDQLVARPNRTTHQFGRIDVRNANLNQNRRQALAVVRPHLGCCGARAVALLNPRSAVRFLRAQTTLRRRPKRQRAARDADRSHHIRSVQRDLRCPFQADGVLRLTVTSCSKMYFRVDDRESTTRRAHPRSHHTPSRRAAIAAASAIGCEPAWHREVFSPARFAILQYVAHGPTWRPSFPGADLIRTSELRLGSFTTSKAITEAERHPVGIERRRAQRIVRSDP
jgi:hypothetical protein